jgi:hypothetical protein
VQKTKKKKEKKEKKETIPNNLMNFGVKKFTIQNIPKK